MQQRFETEEATRRGLSPDEYGEVLRRAQQIRAEKEGTLSRDVMIESAAEVGIREEDIREAERRIAEERRRQEAKAEARKVQKKKTRTGAGIAAGVLALMMVFSYNGLNSDSVQALRARANLQATLQRRADLIPQLAQVVREGSAREGALVDKLTSAREKLQSGDLARQLQGSRDLTQVLALTESNPQFRSTGLYQDLTAEVAGTENRINVARQRYNEAAAEYNRSAHSFPTGLFRPVFGMPGNMPLFQATVDVGKPPKL